MEIFMPPKEVMTIHQIRDAYSSNDYNAELLLKHILIRVAELEAALERRVVAFSGDRLLCQECHAVTTGSVQDMALRHADGCPISGRVTHHPSR